MISIHGTQYDKIHDWLLENFSPHQYQVMYDEHFNNITQLYFIEEAFETFFRLKFGDVSQNNIEFDCPYAPLQLSRKIDEHSVPIPIKFHSRYD
jgi:hypothetical protein